MFGDDSILSIISFDSLIFIWVRFSTSGKPISGKFRILRYVLDSSRKLDN